MGAASAAAACGPEPMSHVGSSHAAGAEMRPVDAGKSAPKLEFLPADYGSRFVSVAQVGTSLHGVGAFEASILAGDDATAAALRNGAAPGSGAVVVESLRDKRSAKPAGALVMRRDGDDWTFFALDESGGVALDPARSPSVAADCAGCHREAPAGGLFPAR